METKAEALGRQGRRLLLMAAEVSALVQRLRAVERRVSLLEDNLSALLSIVGGGERHGEE
ncbi:MAG: hypothetical protein QW567_00575 [Candidatus Hadarchaeales archaeon]